MRRIVHAERRLSATTTGSPAVVLEPIDVATTKQVLRFTSTSEDALLANWITAARQYFEDQTSRQVLAALWEISLDAFPDGGVIELPHPPLLSVVSVVYDDSTGDEQPFDAGDYGIVSPAVGSPAVVTDPFAPRAQIVLPASGSWPTPVDRARAVRVQFWAGYGWTADDVPEIIKACLYDLVRHFHSRPEGDLPLTLKQMIRMFRDSAIAQVAMERA